MIYYETELYHHGILGQKWGVRRYQKKDGTRTSLGKKRERQGYSEEKKSKAKKVAAGVAVGAAGVGATAATLAAVSKNTQNTWNPEEKNGTSDKKTNSKILNSKWNEQTIKGGKGQPNKSPSQVVFEQGGRSLENASNILKEANKYKKTPNRAAGMSDKELRDRVNRIRLENDYNRLTEGDRKTGMDYALSALSILGSLAAIGASAAVIIGTVKGINK